MRDYHRERSDGNSGKIFVGSLAVFAAVMAALIAGCNGETKPSVEKKPERRSDIGTITEIAKPQELLTKAKPALAQPPLPTGREMKEMPYVETAPEPKLTDAETSRGYLLFTRPITEVVYPNTRPLPTERFESLSAFATPGEFEPVTFSIYPTRDLQNLKVRVSDLKREGGGVIPEKNLSCHLVTYWNIGYPTYRSDKTYRRVPELLEEVNVHSSPKGECQRYWIKIKVPDETAPGLYTGCVTLWDDWYEKAVRIPLAVKVLGFKLQKDPKKHFTAYYYDYLDYLDPSYASDKRFNDKLDWYKKAGLNTYRSMADYGFDCMPTMNGRYDAKAKKLYIPNADFRFAEGKKCGLDKGPTLLIIESFFGAYYREFTKTDWKIKISHWKVPTVQDEAFYTELTRMIREFEKERQEKGWPEFWYGVMDEVDASAVEFSVKCHQAVRDAGVRIYITKDVKASDFQQYKDVIDVWCGQPYSAGYEYIKNNPQYTYWCYPNHNSWERRVPSIMCKGGRMTYGFGFWRSGYEGLTPWAWRPSWRDWNMNYLEERGSPAGNVADQNGNIINPTYWECFREGYDDSRYLYTLQQAIVEREGNRKCAAEIAEAKKLLQEIWDSVNVQQKYLDTGMWPSGQFNGLRLKVALMTEKLLSFPASNPGKIAPSVLVTDTADKPTADVAALIENEIAKGNIEVLDLGDEDFPLWQSITGEGKTELDDKLARVGKKSLKYTIVVDHKTDGGGEAGDYPIGWPRMRSDYNKFKKGGIDFTQYEYFRVFVRVESDRDEVADDSTQAYLTYGADAASLPSSNILGAVNEREWIPVIIPLSDVIDKNADLDPWRRITSMQFGIGESHYNDGTKITFNLDGIALLRFKTPVIESVDAPETVILPRKLLRCPFNLMGTGSVKAGEYVLDSALQDDKGATVQFASRDLHGAQAVELELDKVKPGKYTLVLKVLKNGVVVTEKKTGLAFIPGPLY